MLMKELTRDELEKQLPNIPTIPENILVKYSLLIQLKGYPATKFRYFSTGSLCSKEDLVIILRTEEHAQKTWNSMYVRCPTNGAIDELKFQRAVEEFDALLQSPFNITNQIISGFHVDLEKVIHFAETKYGRNYKLYGAYFYYLNKSEVKKLGEPKLHDDYYFDKPDLEEDVKKILENYPHSYPQTTDTMRNRIKHLPCAIVRVKATKELAGYFIVEEYGFITLQFTYPRHRNKGIGQAMEHKLIKDCADFGIDMPYKMIELYNEKLIENHKNNKLWTCPMNDDGTPKRFTFAVSMNHQSIKDH